MPSTVSNKVAKMGTEKFFATTQYRNVQQCECHHENPIARCTHSSVWQQLALGIVPFIRCVGISTPGSSLHWGSFSSAGIIWTLGLQATFSLRSVRCWQERPQAFWEKTRGLRRGLVFRGRARGHACWRSEAGLSWLCAAACLSGCSWPEGRY